MSSGGPDLSPRPERPAEESLPVRLVRVIAALALTLLIIAAVALLIAPKDAATLTLYGMVIGLNLLIVLLCWPVIKWLQRLSR